MNKDLEKEYKELMQKDAPDLWGRIEAGLEPKEQTVKRMNFRKNYRVWGTLAAAVICLAIAVPILFGELSREEVVGHNRGGKTNFAPASDSGASDKNMSAGGHNSAENFDAQGNYAADNAGSANLADLEERDGSGSDSNSFFTVTGKVIEVFEEEDEEEDEKEFPVKVFLVRVAETDCDNLVEGDVVRLYGWRDLGDRLLEGETYRFYIVVAQLNGDEDEYYIYDYQSQSVLP